jgi:hypothetical protein
MPTIYPAPTPTISGDYVTASRFLANPTLVTRRLRQIAQQRYIADRLLTGRYQVQGGAVMYETGESMFADRDPEAVGPLSKYPRTTIGEAAASLAATKKWGEDTPISDEAIKRRGQQGMNVVDKAMQKQVNTNVRLIDSLAISAISSAVTATIAATAAWSGATAKQILDDVLQAKASIIALNQGYDPDVVALDDSHWAYALSAFVNAGWLPREALTDNPALTGRFPEIAGLTFLPTPNVIASSTVLVADSTQLGGMADEDLGGPGYGRVGGDAPGVEGKTIRLEEEDGWLVRCRRVTVPIVQEPAAAKKITGA